MNQKPLTPNQATAVDADARHLSPWMVVGGFALLAIGFSILLGLVAAVVAPPASPVPAGVARAELTDGSVLVLHGITEASQLELPEVTEPGWESFFDRLFGRTPPTVTMHSSSYGRNSLTLWLARYDALTGQPLPFDNWSHTIVRTPAGTQASDGRYASRMTRRSHPHTSTSSTSGDRPLHPVDPDTYSHIVYASSVPRVRSATGEVEVDVYQLDAGLIGTLTAPLPGGPTTYPSWTPGALPAIADDGDLQVTLTSLTSQVHHDASEDARRPPRREIEADLSVQQNGKASALWNNRQVWISDALGNECHPYDCTLSLDEQAWKIGVRLFRSDEAALLQGSDVATRAAADPQRLVIEDISLPDDDPNTAPNSTPLSDGLTLDGVTISLLGVGGPGKCEYQFKTTGIGRGTHHTGDGIQAEFEPPTARLTVDNDTRHIALTVEGDSVNQNVVLILTDQNGLRLKTGWARQMNEVRVWTFEADEWVSTINVYMTVQRARNVEFTVAPPRSPEPE